MVFNTTFNNDGLGLGFLTTLNNNGIGLGF